MTNEKTLREGINEARAVVQIVQARVDKARKSVRLAERDMDEAVDNHWEAIIALNHWNRASK